MEKPESLPEKMKILILVGIIPPYTCEDSFSHQMLEFYLLKAKDALPDLKWEIREFSEVQEEE
jgi:hypothetical protein